MPDTRLDNNKFSWRELLRPAEDFARQMAEHQLRFQRLVEPALRQAAAVAQAMRQPLPEPQQRQIAVLTRLYRDAQQPAPEWLCQFNRFLDGVQRSKSYIGLCTFARDVDRRLRSRPPPSPPSKARRPQKPKNLAVRQAVQTLGDMPERDLWAAVRRLPGLSGTRRAQVTQARWANFGHPPPGRRSKTPKKPKLIAAGAV